MLGYAWVQLLQTLLNCFPKRLYFIFTQHGHVLVDTQYCVREEFFPHLRPPLIGCLVMFPDGFIVILGLLYAKIFSYF